MRKIKSGIIGTGFIGASHIDAVKRIGHAELVAIADSNRSQAEKKADEYCIPKCYGSVDEILADESIEVIHNCTPNNLHTEINEKIIKAGRHVFSEKPLAMTSAESGKMLELLNQNSNLVHGVNFNYRMNPLVQEMKNKVASGEIGFPRLVHGSYLQDWLFYETDYNWRLEPEVSGMSRAIADIGSHWMDSVQVITGSKIVELCADLATLLPTRKKPKTSVETFSKSSSADSEDVQIRTEDYGAVLFKMSSNERGVFYVSQVSAGRKCFLNFEINGSKSSMYWNQEVSDQMWLGFRDRDNCQVIRNPEFLSSGARQYTHLPAGHPEGWNDALRNNISSFYKFISDGKLIGRDSHDFASFEDGHYIMKLTEAILESNQKKGWVKVG